MRSFFRHSIAVLIVAAVIAACAAIGGPAMADVLTSSGFRYTVSNNEVTIVGSESTLAGSITIPSQINNMPVVSIGEGAFYGNQNITAVTISDGISFVEKEAFAECDRLTAVVMPDSVLCINEKAFKDCDILSDVTISSSVSLIDTEAFENCTSLYNITIPGGVTEIGSRAFRCCTSLMSVTIEGQVTSIGASAFDSCISLCEITLPGSVTSIGDSAFNGCWCISDVYYSGTKSQLEAMQVGVNNEQLMNIESCWTFVDGFMQFRVRGGVAELTRVDPVEALAKVLVPGTIGGYPLYAIGVDAFNGCVYMTGVILPSSLTHIRRNAFVDCPSLAKVNYAGTEGQLQSLVVEMDNDDLVNAQWYVVEGTNDDVPSGGPVVLKYEYIIVNDDDTGDQYIIITEASQSIYGAVAIPSKIDGVPVRSIAEDAFSNRNITSVVFSEGIAEIGNRAFSDCSLLSTVSLPFSLETVCKGAFDGCTNIADVIYYGLQENVLTVVDSEYNDCLLNAEWSYRYDPELRFTTIGVSLENNLIFKYKVRISKVLAGTDYENLHAIIRLNDDERDVVGVLDGEFYVFEFQNIYPQLIGDDIVGTVYAYKGGVEYRGKTTTQNILTYCVNQLSASNDSQGKLRRLLVDLVNYSSAVQTYANYKTDTLANQDARFNSAWQGWGTQTDPTCTNYTNARYETVSNPEVTWKGIGLTLDNKVVIRYTFIVADPTGVTVQFRNASGNLIWTATEDDFVPTVVTTSNGQETRYIVFLDKLIVTQMREIVYAKAYRGGDVISNTLQYSIESYASANWNNTKLKPILRTMMNYGDSAIAYVQ